MKTKLFFKNSKGNKLCGILSNPTDNKEKPIIVLCHGFSTSKDNHTNTSLEPILNKNNISTFRFDFFGHGESEGKFENITISEAVDDTLNAIKFLKENNYSKTGLFGSSFGGITSLIIASKIKDLILLALKSPVSDYQTIETEKQGKKGIEEWKDKGFIYYEKGDGTKLRINYFFFDDFKNFNVYELVKQIKIPTLIVHGDLDEVVPIEQSKKTFSLIKNCKLEIIKGAGHDYSKPEHFEKMIELISKFIIEHCR